jgi:hypothetical protein
MRNCEFLSRSVLKSAFALRDLLIADALKVYILIGRVLELRTLFLMCKDGVKHKDTFRNLKGSIVMKFTTLFKIK